MSILRLSVHRLRRIYNKFLDLYSTSGSLPRACLYVVKFIIAKRAFMVSHAKSMRRTRDVQAEIRRKRQLASGTFVLAVKLSGGVGDYLVAARFIRDLIAQGGPIVFDVYCNNGNIATWLFAGFAGFRDVYSEFIFDRVADEYNCGLWVSQFVIMYRSDASSRRMLPSYVRLEKILSSIEAFRPNIAPFIERHPFQDGQLAQYAVSMNYTRANFLHGIAGIPYGGERLEIPMDESVLRSHGLESRRYMTIHNGFDPAFIITASVATKCYPYFSDVVRILKRVMPEVVFVQVGTTTSTPISGVDVNLVNKTSIEQVAALIKHSFLHIDNESGLVHLARCFGVKCCVVFGPTPADYFGYMGNINVDPPVCGRCWWVNETWMDDCPRGYHEPRCMTQQKPESVAAAILGALAARVGEPSMAADLPRADCDERAFHLNLCGDLRSLRLLAGRPQAPEEREVRHAQAHDGAVDSSAAGRHGGVRPDAAG